MAPGTSAPDSLPVGALLMLLGLAAFAFDALHLQLGRNGYSALMETLLADNGEVAFLPGSEDPIRRRYTGVAGVDKILALTSVVFANVADGSRPEFSLFVFCFGGQLVAFLVVVMTESLRTVSWASVVFNPIAWGLAMQLGGAGLIVPIFFFVHLVVTMRSSISSTVRLRDYASLNAVAPAFIIGYILPSIALAYPLEDRSVAQVCNALWQIFPVYVFSLAAVFSGMAKSVSVGENAFTPRVQLERRALNRAYGFAWNVGVVTQLATYAVLFAARLAPGVFPAGVAGRLTPGRVFEPVAIFHSSAPAEPAAAMHNFFQYDLYTASAAGLVWAVYQLSRVTPVLSSKEERYRLAGGVFTGLVVSGPGGALASLMQLRDETVLAAEAKAEKVQ